MNVVLYQMYDSLGKIPLIAVLLFLLAGELMNRGDITKRLLELSRVVARLSPSAVRGRRHPQAGRHRQTQAPCDHVAAQWRAAQCLGRNGRSDLLRATDGGGERRLSPDTHGRSHPTVTKTAGAFAPMLIVQDQKQFHKPPDCDKQTIEKAKEVQSIASRSTPRKASRGREAPGLECQGLQNQPRRR